MSGLVFKPPGPVSRAFMLSDAFVRGLKGPVGSAKSSTSIMEMHRRQIQQRPNERGQRMSRWAVIRNTNPMLKTTTIKTYEDWLDPAFYGDIKMAPPPYEHEIDVQLPDKTRVVAEVYFLSLDRPEDMRKLLSLELTGAFVNEARELPKTIIDGVTQRLRRYPSQRDGGFNWSGLIMDTNAPDDDHWWPIMAGEVPPPEGMPEEDIKNLVKPADWAFFNQPPAMIEQFSGGRLVGYELNPEAENIQNLDPTYYPGMIPGKTKAWIDVYILNRLGATHDGRPVHTDFRKDTHVAEQELEAADHVPIIVGADFGLTPAAIFFQRVRERIVVLREIVLTDAGAIDLGRAINRLMASEFPDHRLQMLWGDPAGDQRVGTDKKTPFAALRALDIRARPAETNDPEIRRAAGQAVLQRMVGGEPAIIFDPRCTTLIAGLAGAWFYKRVRGVGELFDDEPAKNRYSHPCEAWEYALLGMGEAREMLGRKRAGEGKTHNIRGKADPLDRFKAARASGRARGQLG